MSPRQAASPFTAINWSQSRDSIRHSRSSTLAAASTGLPHALLIARLAAGAPAASQECEGWPGQGGDIKAELDQALQGQAQQTQPDGKCEPGARRTRCRLHVALVKAGCEFGRRLPPYPCPLPREREISCTARPAELTCLEMPGASRQVFRKPTKSAPEDEDPYVRNPGRPESDACSR